MKERFGIEVLALSLYFVLALATLYPFSIFNINSQLIGDGGDTFQGLWNLWWVKHSVLSFSNPFMTNFVFFPIGANLYVHALSPAAGFLTIPIQLTFGLVASYNLLIILSFVLGGYGAYRVALYLTTDKKASFFGGLVFGFSAYHFAKAWGHLNLFSIEWIPFYLLFLFKMRNENSLKNCAYAVVFLLLTALMSDLEYLLFLGLFTLMLFVYDSLFQRKRIKGFLIRLGVVGLVFSGFMFLLQGPLLIGMLNGDLGYSARSPSDSVLFSADLLGFFTPSSLNPIFGQYSKGIIAHFSTTGIESVVYIGYTVLSLVAFAVIKMWKRVRFWLIGTLSFTILSLGPMLHIFGETSFTSLNLTIPLPELLLRDALPIFRVPSRFMVMTMICLAIICSIALSHTNAWFAKFRRSRILGIAFLVFISTAFIIEVNMIPFPVVEDISVPTFYSDLAKMNRTFSILELPQNDYANNRYMYYSTISGKPLVGGTLSRIGPRDVYFLLGFPLFGQMNYAGSGKNPQDWRDMLAQDVNTANLNSFCFFKVGYVVLHKEFLTDAAFGLMNQYLDTLLGSPVYCDDRIFAYDTNVTQMNGVFTFLSSGWGALEEFQNVPIRHSDGNGIIGVVSPSNQKLTVSFYAKASDKNERLKILLNGELVGSFRPLTSSFYYISLPGLNFSEGINELTFWSTHPWSIAIRKVNVHLIGYKEQQTSQY